MKKAHKILAIWAILQEILWAAPAELESRYSLIGTIAGQNGNGVAVLLDKTTQHTYSLGTNTQIPGMPSYRITHIQNLSVEISDGKNKYLIDKANNFYKKAEGTSEAIDFDRDQPLYSINENGVLVDENGVEVLEPGMVDEEGELEDDIPNTPFQEFVVNLLDKKEMHLQGQGH